MKGKPDMKYDPSGDLLALIWWAGLTGVGTGVTAEGVNEGAPGTIFVGVLAIAMFFPFTVRMYLKIRSRINES